MVCFVCTGTQVSWKNNKIDHYRSRLGMSTTDAQALY